MFLAENQGSFGESFKTLAGLTTLQISGLSSHVIVEVCAISISAPEEIGKQHLCSCWHFPRYFTHALSLNPYDGEMIPFRFQITVLEVKAQRLRTCLDHRRDN